MQFRFNIGDLVYLKNGQGPLIVNARHYNSETGVCSVELVWMNDVENLQRAVVNQEVLQLTEGDTDTESEE